MRKTKGGVLYTYLSKQWKSYFITMKGVENT